MKQTISPSQALHRVLEAHARHQRLASLLLVAISLILLPVTGFAQGKADVSVAHVDVTGIGEVALTPDLAILDLTVRREAESARDAVTGVNQAMSAVTDYLRGQGIAERDLQTSQFSVEPRLIYPQQGREQRVPEIVGYTARLSLGVRVRDLARIGEFLDQAISLGVNQGGGIRFTNEKTQEPLRQARAAAMVDARERARVLVEAVGARLGPIIRISEATAQARPRPMAGMRMMEVASDDAGSVPIASGENRLSVQVNVRWAIDQ